MEESKKLRSMPGAKRSRSYSSDQESVYGLAESANSYTDSSIGVPPYKRQRTENVIGNAEDLISANFAIQAKLVARQRRGRRVNSQSISDAQKKIELLNRFQDPYYNRDNKKKQETIKARLLEAEERETRELLAEMDHANDEDHRSIALAASGKKNSRQAMNRFRLLPKISTMLRQKGVQTQFLSLQGCSIIERWLSPNPDKSFPPCQVVEQVLDVLDSLPIEIQHL